MAIVQISDIDGLATAIRDAAGPVTVTLDPSEPTWGFIRVFSEASSSDVNGDGTPEFTQVGSFDDLEHTSGRDRWWRAAHDATSWTSAEFEDDPDARAADDWLLRHNAHLTARWLHQWLEERQDWSPEWRDAAGQSDYHLQLTPERLRALSDELHAVLDRHRDTAVDPSDETERVTVVIQAFPSPTRVP